MSELTKVCPYCKMDIISHVSIKDLERLFDDHIKAKHSNTIDKEEVIGDFYGGPGKWDGVKTDG